MIGVDVGGTNTDSVLLNPSKIDDENRGVLSYHKTGTTADVSSGISTALNSLFDAHHTQLKEDVCAITIGTTHFINAVIEQDRARLEPVAILRLCGPYSKGTPPFSDFPESLTKILEGYVGYVDGGHRVDGLEIQPLDEKAIVMHAEKIKDIGLRAVAIVGIFSMMDDSHERRAADLVRLVIPDAHVVESGKVSGVGFLARENASILNASVMAFAQKIIMSFISSVRQLGFKCPILLTQNDGTVLPVQDAEKTPIRTFSSGPTNSMRGAAFLCSIDHRTKGKSIMVVDIGGTTTDVGLLLSNGFPRQVSAQSIVGGVRMNFSMPHVESVGLGGGSIVEFNEDEALVGPNSVGSEITTKSLVFGGETVTATDLTVASGARSDGGLVSIGTVSPSELHYRFTKDQKSGFAAAVKNKLEKVIDRMKTSPDPIPVLLVGGGSFIAPLELQGALVVMRPPYYQVANAIGAAMGKLSALVDHIETLTDISQKQKVIERLTAMAVSEIVSKGALLTTTRVVDLVYDPVPYVNGAYSFHVKVLGDIDHQRVAETYLKITINSENSGDQLGRADVIKDSRESKDIVDDSAVIDHRHYKPIISKEKEWIISETDLDYIRVGSYILGCGGGGTPYPMYLETRNMIRNGAVIKVVNLFDITQKTKGEGKFISVGYAGSPTVNDEQLHGRELPIAAEALFNFINERPDGVLALEIGGGNGFTSMYCGASTMMDSPVIDADLMGRAYPTHNQVLPCALSETPFWRYTSASDGNGNDFLITGAQNDHYVEKMLRAALSQVGCRVGVVNTPMTSKQLESMTVHHSISTAWRIGKAVLEARQDLDFENLPTRILKAVGGSVSGRQIFEGKIVGVEKKLMLGHVYGEVVIENQQGDKLKIPFKNENILAEVQRSGHGSWECVCSVPDLISVCYADSGEACGTPDYRYGIFVFVIAFAPSTQWTATERAMNLGGPKAFGPPFDRVTYKPVGTYDEPKSVIDEYFTQR